MILELGKRFMPEPVEFASFYQLLQSVKEGSEEQIKELQWMLAEYEHAKDATNAYDELGQIFCHHGVMELYEYTGVENVSYINSLDNSVWDYLNIRMETGLHEYMVKSMLNHAKDHQLAKKVSNKWDGDFNEIEENIEDLANYVAEGIVQLIV